MRRGGSTTTSAGEHHSLNIIVFLPFSLLSSFLLFRSFVLSLLSIFLPFFPFKSQSRHTDSFLPVLAWQLCNDLPFPRICSVALSHLFLNLLNLSTPAPPRPHLCNFADRRPPVSKHPSSRVCITKPVARLWFLHFFGRQTHNRKLYHLLPLLLPARTARLLSNHHHHDNNINLYYDSFSSPRASLED